MLSTSESSAPAPLQAVTRSSGYQYLLSLPGSNEAAKAERWPLLFFLHGTAPRGSNVWDVTQQGPTRLLAGIGGGGIGSTASIPAAEPLTAHEREVAVQLARQFVVVAPQCPHYEVWNDAELLALLDEIVAALRIDPARVYLTGLSMGGFGAWSLAMRHPAHFAAVVPICGGGRVADIAQSTQQQPSAFHHLAVWAFHGARDPVVPLDESERMVAAVKKAGARDAGLTVYSNALHDAWTETYANPELYAWLLRQAR